MQPLGIEQFRSVAVVEPCPFSDGDSNTCTASLSSMVIAPSSKYNYCFSENYDNCPLFLSKVLRRG
jgi:hypothetical protein